MFSVDFPSVFGVMSFSHRVNSEGVRLIRSFFKSRLSSGRTTEQETCEGLGKVLFTHDRPSQ